MTSIKFEITWEDVQDIAVRHGNTLSQKQACELLADIEGGVRHWFNETKGDAISDSFPLENVGFSKNECVKKALDKAFGKKYRKIATPKDPHEPREYNDAESVITMGALA